MTRQPLYKSLYFQVLVAIAIGILIGHFFPQTGVALKPLGDSFVKLIKMAIAPIIFCTVVTGIAGMRDLGKVGGVALKAFAYFIVVSSFALVVGLTVANVVQPGAGMNIDPATLDAGGKVVFGATVELEDEASGAAVTYQIVGEDEADLKLGLVNIGSPIARALIGKEEGDVAEVQAPGGTK
eukprot:gene47788-58547_t